MTLNRKAFEVAWRIAILSLPWQARLFWDASLAGWPWEQGRIAIYASWLPLLAAIILGLFQPKRPLPLALRRNIFWLVAALGACTVVAAPSPATAAMQWWIQMMLLAGFCITLLRTQVHVRKVAFWAVISLIPHAILAIIQAMTQTVWASKWLGMAAQNPADLGVSVVQTAAGRFLRAYGGFPHPNILGGWMAVGLIVALWLIVSPNLPQPSLKLREGARRAGELCLVALFTLALFYSFSRSAWLAAAVGLTLFVFLSFLRKRESRKNNPPKPSFDKEGLKSPLSKGDLEGLDSRVSSDSAQDDKKRILISFATPIFLFVTLTILHHSLVFTRLDAGASRLERKSVVTRIQTLRDGIDVFRAVPLFGTGPNSELPVLASLKERWIKGDSTRIADIGPLAEHEADWNADEYVRSRMAAIGPLEPPHMVWLLMLVNFGTVGALFIFGFGLFILRRILEKWRDLSTSSKTLLATLSSFQFVVCSLDHYPWSLWAGQTLTAVTLYILFVLLSRSDGSGSLDA